MGVPAPTGSPSFQFSGYPPISPPVHFAVVNVTTVIRFEVAPVVDHEPMRGIADEENDHHAGSSDFLDLRHNLLDPRSFLSVKPIPAQP